MRLSRKGRIPVSAHYLINDSLFASLTSPTAHLSACNCGYTTHGSLHIQKRRDIPTRTDNNETPLIHLNPENGWGATWNTQLTGCFTVGMGVFARSTRAPSIIASTTHDPFSCGRHGVCGKVSLFRQSAHTHHVHSTAERTQRTLIRAEAMVNMLGYVNHALVLRRPGPGDNAM